MEADMTTRRAFVASAALVASSLALAKSALAQTPEAKSKTADFLFVQTAKGMKFDKATNKLTLTGVAPMTLFFTDRPERIAGNMKTTAFIPFWSEGKDSFKIISGEMPTTASDVSVFIDIIGRPLTPLSFAGMARRSYRRAYYGAYY